MSHKIKLELEYSEAMVSVLESMATYAGGDEAAFMDEQAKSCWRRGDSAGRDKWMLMADAFRGFHDATVDAVAKAKREVAQVDGIMRQLGIDDEGSTK